MRSTLESFDEILKSHYPIGRIEKLIGEEQAFFCKMKAQEIDGMYAAPVLTPALIMVTATLGGLEWLRHRKAQVAATQTEEEWKSLADEFWDWLSNLFKLWRGECINQKP